MAEQDGWASNSVGSFPQANGLGSAERQSTVKRATAFPQDLSSNALQTGAFPALSQASPSLIVHPLN